MATSGPAAPSRRQASLTLRLVAAVLLSQFLLAGGLIWIGERQTRRQLASAFQTELRARAESVAALVRYPEKGPGLLFDAALLPPAPARPEFYRVRGPADAPLANTFPAGIAPPPATAGGRTWDFMVAGVPYRGLAQSGLPVLDTEEDIPGPPPRLTVAYARSTADLQRQVAATAWRDAGLSLLVLLLASLLAAAMIRRELHPLRDLARQAAAISPRQWSFAPDPRTAATAELAPLIRALELMLGRLQSSFRRQHDFLADAAHELKTPVAILKSTFQALLQRPRADTEYRAAAAASLQDVERLEQLIERMLRLARSEQLAEPRAAGRPAPDLPATDLAATCAAAVARVQALAAAGQVAIETACTPGWRLRAEPDDLETVWVNLLENAVQHSPPGSRVLLRCAATAACATITVEDQGTGIAPADLPHIFERFHRGAAARSRPGFGLGLAIAHAIVAAYGGEIVVHSPPGAGTRVAVTLPLGPAWIPVRP